MGTYDVSTPLGKAATSKNTSGCPHPSYGRDGPGSTAILYNPSDIDVDSAGNVFIMQSSGDIRIRVMDPQGNITSLVKGGSIGDGNIISGVYPDNNPDNIASGYQGSYLCVDRSTDIVFFPDYAYHYIRVLLSNSGTPTTISGKPTPSGINNYSGGGVTSIINRNTYAMVDGNENTSKFSHPGVCTYDPVYKRLYVADDRGIVMIDNGYGRSTGVGPTNADKLYASSLYAPTGVSGTVPITGLTTDLSGNLFYTMAGKHSIWKIVPPPNGNVMGTNINNYGNGSTKCILNAPVPTALKAPAIFAGSDRSGGYSDSLTAGGVSFNTPLGLSCDSKNNIYVADSLNNVIRVITPQGAVYTVAGVQNNSSDLATVANFGDGVNTIARFSLPISVAVDTKNSIYVLDRGTSRDAVCGDFMRIRKITLISPPSAPTGFKLINADPITATFSWGAALTGREPDYIASFYFLVQTAANPTDTRLDIQPIPTTPTGLTANAIPNQFIINNTVAVTGRQGFYINNLISVPLTPNTTYTSIKLVAFNNTGQNVSDPITSLVVKPAVPLYTLIKCGKVGVPGYVNGGAIFSQFNSLKGIAMDKDNKAYVVDSGNNCIRTINNIGESVLFFGEAPNYGSTMTTLNRPSDVTFSYSGGFPLYVADTGNNRILIIGADGKAKVLAIPTATPPTLTLSSPTSIAIDPTGNLYVTSSSNHCIYMINTEGGLSLFAGIVGTAGAVDGAGAVDIFNTPTGIVYDAAQTCLYVADTGNHLIRKILFDSKNTVCTLAGSKGLSGIVNGLGSVARFNAPTELATDSDGNLYVTDLLNHCIRKITVAGLVSTYSGTAGTAGFADGSSTPTAYNAITTNVKYNGPLGICRNSTGVIYITDSLNGCIRYISTVAPPTAPTISLAEMTNSSATISWSGDTGGTFYAYSISPMSSSIVLPKSTSSPATFSGLLDSTKYSLSLIVGNTVGAIYPDPVSCITAINDDKFVLTVPKSDSVQGIGNIKSIVTADLNWTGVTAADTIQYSINPAQNAGTTTGTFPLNQQSPYTISDLSPGKAYTIILSATINNAPLAPQAVTHIRFTVMKVPGGTGTDYSVASFSIMNGATTIPWPAGTRVYPVTVGTTTQLTVANPADNGPQNLLNTANNIGKYFPWYPRGTGSVNPAAVIFALGAPTQFTGYNFGVADLLNRTPNRWKLEYSTDGINFNMLDDRSTLDQTLPTTTGTNTSTYPIKFSTTYRSTSKPVTFSTQQPPPISVSTIAGWYAGGSWSVNSTATKTPRKDLLSVILKDPRALAMDKNGALFVTSGTCIVKITPPTSSVNNYYFDTSVLNPTPILVSPSQINAINGSTITLYAGDPAMNGSPPASATGDSIRFYNIIGLSYDKTLDCLYVSDMVHTICKVTMDSTGTVKSEVIAGDVGGFSGTDDGALGKNRLNSAKGTSTGPDGSLFIADSQNSLVRKLSGGILSTISDASFTGSLVSDIAVWSDGSVFVTCPAHHCIRKLTPSTVTPVTYTSTVYAGLSGSSGNTDGTLTAARFTRPQGITVDSKNNMYVVDSGNYTVRRITGNNVITLTGSGSSYADGSASAARFKFTGADATGQNTFAGIQSDNFGNIYLADHDNFAIVRLISMGGPTITEAELANYKSSAAIMYQVSSAVQQRDSSAKQQTASSALQQRDSSAKQQVDSSAKQQVDSSAQVVRASSALQQAASSAVQQTVSSAKQQVDSSAKRQVDSSAQVVRASSAVRQAASSAVQQAASSAVLQSALSGPVSVKDEIMATVKAIEADIATNTAIAYSQTAAQADKDTAKATVMTRIGDLTGALSQLATASQNIFTISPNYQDRSAQKVIPDPYLQSIGQTKLYDSMRKAYIVIDANGYIVPNLEQPDKRPLRLGQKGGAVVILPTDMELVGDLTIPSEQPWKSYFDTLDRRYFYVNTTAGIEQYEHPFLPVLSSSHTVVTDTSVNFLPPGWIKLQSITPNVPYYFNSTSSEVSWVHPNLPPNPDTLQKVTDASLNAPYEKYMDPTTARPFYVHSITREAQWDFPDLAFNPGPSTAVRASSAAAVQLAEARASSAVQQGASSAVQQGVSSAAAVKLAEARASSAVQQGASSAVQQSASSALAVQASQARASSALQQGASSAKQQSASSAVQQGASSAVQQGVSSAVQQGTSSAQQQGASSAQIQKASSAKREAASLAVQQVASSAVQQGVSSAQQQGASSAQIQKASSAKREAASLAVQQVASSAVQQLASSAQKQGASSAQLQDALRPPITAKDTIKSAITPLKSDVVSLIQTLYSSGGSTDVNKAALQQKLGLLTAKQNELVEAGRAIFTIDPNYQDTELQSVVQNPTLSAMGIKKVFDQLRNTYIFLDSNNTIVSDPLTVSIQRGGVSKEKTRKKSKKV